MRPFDWRPAKAGMEGVFMNKLRLNCCRMLWLRRSRLLAMFVVSILLPLPLFAETVLMVNDQAAYYTYSLSLSGSLCNAGDYSIVTAEFPTKAEALAAGLSFHQVIQCSGGAYGSVSCDLSVKADPNPDNWQRWQVCSYPTFTDVSHYVYPIYARFHLPGKHCPTPITRPGVLFTPDPNGLTCSRPDNLIITLSGGTTIEPWNQGRDPNHQQANLPFKAMVKDQNGQPKAGIEVTITTEVTTNSGGHNHNDNRLKGKLVAGTTASAVGGIKIAGNTDSSGVFAFTFGAEEASGEHRLTATCTGCQAEATATVNVKVDGLATIPASPFYTSVGATDKHTDNHYLTPAAASVLRSLAVSYQVEQRFKLKAVTPPLLHLNDASLVWGGVFDLDADWAIPHKEHMRGTVIDIRANSLAGAIAPENFYSFRVLAKDIGANAKIHNPGGVTQHFHVRLLGRGE